MKKIILVLGLLCIGIVIYAQPIDSLTSAQATTHKVVRLKLNETIDQVNTNTDSISTLDSEKLNLADSSGFGAGKYATTYAVSLKAPLADPVFTGTAKLSADTLATRAYARSVAGSGGEPYDTTYLYTELDTLDQRITAIEDSTVEADNTLKLVADTVNFFVFGWGSSVKDTANAINGAEVGSFYWKKDTLMLAPVHSWVLAGSGSETISLQIYYGTNYGTKVDSLFSPAVAITSQTGANNTPDEATQIPPNSKVWGIISGVSAGNKPAGLRANLMGYVKRTEE